MNLSITSDESEKAWDHPWTTDEMRQYQSDWSLAGDVGLLRHLQQFSENLTATVKNTQTTLDLLNSQLSETTVLIDNVTNASLALANTQFIESRVYEDDIDNGPQQDLHSTKTDEKQLPNNETISEAEIIAAVSENIQQGLAMMDEKYERVEVISSDSEDDNEIPQQSFILRPKDPYQNRPLPYVIGSDKWKTSSRIGLESSSSESEVFDDEEDDDETENDKDMDELSQHIFIENSRRISILRRTSSSSSSESSEFNETSITNKQYSGTSSHTDNKLYTRSQDTLNSTSEITTPTVGLSRGGEYSTRDTPSFAQELAKRLGNVIPSHKTIGEKRDINQSSINRHVEDDLFANDENKNDNIVRDGDDYGDNDGDIFSAKSDNLFSGGGGLFDDDGEVSDSLWKNKPIKRSQTNIIPPIIDVPPPMHSTETKQKSAIDDLFGDGDSDDSDDIFAPKIPHKSATIKPSKTVNIPQNNVPTPVIAEENLLGAIKKTNTNKITTSTPETNNNIPNLFEDDGNDGNLFGSSKKPTNSKLSSETPRTLHKGRPPGILVSQSDLLTSNLGSRLFNRTRQESSDSSENENEVQQPHASKRENNETSSNGNNSNISPLDSSAMEVSNRVHVETSDSSGISIHPQSMNSTLSLGGANNWTPQMESTRIPSEELYRDRLVSDSLLNPETRQQNSNPTTTVSSGKSSSATRRRESRNTHEESLFENDDDVFGPPPLPKNKLKSESKVTSLFDDSDSGDDLFSNTSSGSRSQKSADILTNLTQQQLVERSKSGQKRGGLFDEGVDVFTNRNASPDIDISTSGSTSKDESQSSKPLQLPIDRSKVAVSNSGELSEKLLTSLSESTSVKPTSIFDDSEPEDEDLFSSIIRNKSVVNKFNDENNFFATSTVSLADQNEVLSVPKKDFTAEVAVEVGDKESKVKSEEYERSKNQTLVTNKVSDSRVVTAAAGENKLFDDSDDGDDDNLFSRKTSVLKSVNIKSQQSQILVTKNYSKEKSNSVIQSVESQKDSMEPVNTSNELGITHLKNEGKDDCGPVMDEEKISEIHENVDNSSHDIHTKKEPPKSLKIRLPIAGVGDDPNFPPRRAVSGKIKDLMGKMGDLKILSPTDTPLLWRKSGDNTNSEDDDDNNNNTPDHDSEDGSSISVPSTKTPSVPSKETFVKKESPRSPSIEIETAVSFDTPAQPDTLTVTASKSRARIPVKRRPQSRHARQSALRTSGIDFDTVDTVVTDSHTDVIDSNEMPRSDPKIERLVTSNDGSDGDGDGYLIRPTRPTLNLISDDKSEISLEKESSISITKNTLLSPSTDEEDLFDVPPDLPEDPQKEDGLFGRAPILSPVQRRGQEKSRNRSTDESENSGNASELPFNKIVYEKDSDTSKKWIDNKADCDDVEQPIDPLRGGTHDQLKDPSQLFAFVTKTPSPEKDHSLLFNEDVSLFSQTIKKANDDTESARKSFDIFANDSSSDLFSGPFTKTTAKKPTKGTKSNLFNDLDSEEDDGTDDLFGSASSKRSNQSKSEHSDIDINEVSITSGNSPIRTDALDDDDDEDLFFDASERLSSETGKEDHLFPASSKVTKARLEDIFGDPSTDNDDIFSIKKSIGRGTVASGLFLAQDNESNTNDIFAKKQQSSSVAAADSVDNRVPMKKAVTRDLRKTAEKIVEDPLSMLHDD